MIKSSIFFLFYITFCIFYSYYLACSVNKNDNSLKLPCSNKEYGYIYSVADSRYYCVKNGKRYERN